MRRKLIEVALPLEAINSESLRRKQKAPKGWPTSFHKWWAQRPLAAARAVIFAQVVDDPSSYVDELRADPKLLRRANRALGSRLKLWEQARLLAEQARGAGLTAPEPGPRPTLDDVLADHERQRLLQIVEEMILWEHTADSRVLQAARDEVWNSWRRSCAEQADDSLAGSLFDPTQLPSFLDPFSGSGSLPLSAQWLGLPTYASDLNPVAVVINKALIEIPHVFESQTPLNADWQARPQAERNLTTWIGAQGLAEDVRHYGKWMREEAERRIGALYPTVRITPQMVRERPDLKAEEGEELTIVAWLWARTVPSPDPAYAQVEVPLATTFMLSTRRGSEHYVEPVVEGNEYRFRVRKGIPADPAGAKQGTKVGRGGNFRCLLSDTPIPVAYIREQGLAGTLDARLMAVVAEGARGRIYLDPDVANERAARAVVPSWVPDLEINHNPRDIRTQLYGLTRYGDLFTPRQLVALTTFSDLIEEARNRARDDAAAAGLPSDAPGLSEGGTGAAAYSDAMAVYLACVVDRMVYYGSSLTTWLTKDNALRDCMPRQALAMAWDFAECNPLGKSSGDISTCTNVVASYLDVATPNTQARVSQADARASNASPNGVVISTDPPYYDNVGYADLSDYFYVWLRSSLKSVFPDLFATLAVPKAEELVATPYRHGDRDSAEVFFLEGMTAAMRRLAEQSHPGFPLTIYYAFKQSENDADEGVINTGWDTFLAAVIEAGLSITGTWPIRTEGAGRMVAAGTNALASSIILVCRPRADDAEAIKRRQFVSALRTELPSALANLQRANIAPVDLAQAAIGPGMAIFTRYAKVFDAEDHPLGVRDALAIINQTLDEALAEQEADLDADSRWAITWFEQSGFEEGDYGVAEQLSKAKNTSVKGMEDAGILESRRGNVRLLRPEELSSDWDPTADLRLPAWEVVHWLVRALEEDGEAGAAALAEKIGTRVEVARELAYRLYNLCERKKWAKEAVSYNSLVQAWPEIMRLAGEVAVQTSMEPE